MRAVGHGAFLSGPRSRWRERPRICAYSGGREMGGAGPIELERRNPTGLQMRMYRLGGGCPVEVAKVWISRVAGCCDGYRSRPRGGNRFDPLGANVCVET